MRCTLLIILPLLIVGCTQKIEPLYPERSVQLDPLQAAQQAEFIKDEVALEVADGLQVQLWAGDTLVQDPIAISVDDQGRIFYTSGTRLTNSEFDIRSHRNWMTASISFETVEDRRAFLKATFSEQNDEGERFLKDLNQDGILDWRDLTVEKEQVWFVEDVAGSGFADRAQLYLEDFHEEITDLANGIEAYNGEVFIAVGPDLWRTLDRDKDGIADKVNSISHGFAVHIGFGAHGMSGAKIGPDGRIWWGIGDIGMNVIDQDGKNWKYPNQGVIVRSELDGSGFEVYSAGLRNTHEFTFDKYGNLISVDNDGDHQGERERLVYLINGSDTGWRINWQFGKYTDPANNDYKVWMEEKLHVPHWDGQAAYILPPITNYVNGPTGLVYNPGTALSEQWYDHFFVAEFRGTPAISPLHGFTLKPWGASFQLDKTHQLVKGVLPTGLDFGPEGALYFADWIDGWNTNDQGRIWKLDVTHGADHELRESTKALIKSDFKNSTVDQLEGHLHHQDMRVRQKAQFELATRGAKGFNIFLRTAQVPGDQLARIHGIWGMAQMARAGKPKYVEKLLSLLDDEDPEIVTQAAKMLGDVRFQKSADALIPLLSHPSLRVQLHACEALGRIGYEPAVVPILDMLEKNDDQDFWLRHAGMVALGRIGDANSMAALKDHPSSALRTAAVVALRRMSSAKVSEFLTDENEYIVLEAARAINDDYSIEEALPALAETLTNPRFRHEALLRRAINANLRVGEEKNVENLIRFIQSEQAPSDMRSEAIAALSGWGKPSVFDRVDGRYRGVVERDDAHARQLLENIIPQLLASSHDSVAYAASNAAGKMSISSVQQELLGLLADHSSARVRAASLQALYDMGAKELPQALQVAFADRDQMVRATALTILPDSNIETSQAVNLLEKVVQEGTYREQQAALSSLGNIKGPLAAGAVERSLDQLMSGRVAPEIQLDIVTAAESIASEELTTKLQAYQESKAQDDPINPFMETLEGGDWRKGSELFYEHEAAQCVRCHTVFELGGTAGPGLSGVADRLTNQELLTSLVAPSASYARGYEVVTLTLENQQTLTGVVMDETADSLKLKTGNNGAISLLKSDIVNRRSVPSSMPPMGAILSKKEIRDILAYLKLQSRNNP